ncbi:MAG: inositol monophosphatase [Spirulina sp. SIO3F2]|nr:inositol monophosphatase [Spirulina sp. SIO3F2]
MANAPNTDVLTPDFWDDVLDFCHQITGEVSDRLLKDFGQLQAVEKADGSLVTDADKWSDQTIRDAIAEVFPEHGVLSEETVHIFPDTDWCWIIDPIDGTTNFARGVPLWGISLGLLYRGTPVFGYVCFPPIAQTFYGYWYGESGLTGPTGAYCSEPSGGDRPIQTRPDPPGKNQLFNLCARSTAVMQQPFPCKIRMMGVATYNCLLVASGATLGAMEATPKIWDIAAVWAIVQAAGGTFATLETQSVFPLVVGENYGDRPFPSLILSQANWLSQFRPLVDCVVA